MPWHAAAGPEICTAGRPFTFKVVAAGVPELQPLLSWTDTLTVSAPGADVFGDAC